jgi:uncharacterized DUF497 family protein
VIYEWDPKKAAANRRKHDISFDDAASVFLDPLALTFSDSDHSIEEQRGVTIGHTKKQQVVFVAHCQRGNRVRIISARVATPRERRQYEEGITEDRG